MKNNFTQILIFGIVLMLPFLSEAQTTTIRVPGQSNPRTIFVHAPSDLGENRPLVISMHGMGNVIEEQKQGAQWELVADTAKFVVVYPQGEGN